MSRKLATSGPVQISQVQDTTDLGKFVRNQRANLGLRIDDAAALCGVSVDLFSRCENGKPITTGKLFSILQGLGLCLFALTAQQAVHLEPSLQALAKELDGQD